MATSTLNTPDVSAAGIARRAAARVSRPRVPEAARVSLRIRERCDGLIELVRRDNGAVFMPCSTREIARGIQEVFAP